jgi:hypothetical protein
MNTTYTYQGLHEAAFVEAYKDGQRHDAFRSWLTIDRDGKIQIEAYRAHADSQDVMPVDAETRLIMCWEIPVDVDAAALEGELCNKNSKIRRLLERIHAGHTIGEEGQGYLSLDAANACFELERIFNGP